jgi:plastocyanin
MRIVTSRRFIRASALSTLLLIGACGGGKTYPTEPTPIPTGDPGTANVYILPGAGTLGPNAFGDEPIVIYRGERMHWTNLDSVEHTVVADTAALPEFVTTGLLAPGASQTFVMNTLGTTKVHCSIHPQETGTVVVRDR